MPVIGRRDLLITRDQVHEWLEEWDQAGRPDLKGFVDAKVYDLGLADTQVDMGDELGVMTPAEIIMDDFDSYGYN
jgi:hypothetical protein